MTRGRPIKYSPDAVVFLRPRGDSTLKKFSDRRAIVDFIVENGGRATIKEINDNFGFDFTHKVIALVRAGWLEVHE